MDSQVKRVNTGQQIQQSDVNTLGKVAALGGDVALQMLLSMVPASSTGAVDKAILPLATDATPVMAVNTPPLASGAGGNGSVAIYPFLAVIGSRGGESTNLQGWKDIRTQVFVSETTGGTMRHFHPIASNASGNPRWDLVYVTMSVDTDDATVTRYVKAPTSSVGTATTVAVTQSTKLTLNTVQGTPAASPVKPSLPADSGSNYNIPLCYVRVANGFGGTTALSIDDIQEGPYVTTLANRTGLATCAPASGCYDPALPMLATRQPWPASGARPRAYLPPTMQGKVERIIPLDLHDSPATAASGDVLDDTIDWRHRVFKWTAQLRSSRDLAWDSDATGALVVPDCLSGNGTFTGLVQSFTLNDTADVARGSLIAAIGGTSTSFDHTTSLIGASAKLAIYVDQDTGELKLFQSGGPGCTWLFWIEATGAYVNSAYV